MRQSNRRDKKELKRKKRTNSEGPRTEAIGALHESHISRSNLLLGLELNVGSSQNDAGGVGFTVSLKLLQQLLLY